MNVFLRVHRAAGPQLRCVNQVCVSLRRTTVLYFSVITCHKYARMSHGRRQYHNTYHINELFGGVCLLMGRRIASSQLA